MESGSTEIPVYDGASTRRGSAHLPAREQRPGAPGVERRRDSTLRSRLNLQRRAGANLRNHVRRAAVRLAVLIAVDVAALLLMRLIARAVRDGAVLGSTIADALAALMPRGVLHHAPQFAVALFVGLLVTGNYGRGDRRRSPRRLFLGSALGLALPFWTSLWSSNTSIIAGQYLILTGVVWLTLLVDRRVIDRLVEPYLHRWRPPARTLLVGPAEACRQAAGTEAFNGAGEYQPLGFADVHVPPAPDALGHVNDVARLLHETDAETVVVCGDVPDSAFREVVEIGLGAKCHVVAVPRSLELPTRPTAPVITWVRGQPFIEIARPVVQAPALFVKRVVDLLAASAGLVILSPLFALIAILIKLDSSGAVFFASRRWGQGGKRIGIWKFRTMVDGADLLLERDPTLLAEYIKGVKLRDDPRVTRVGRWLRRWSLDELPQLFNVLEGTMSLVGPRPKLVEEEERYGPLFPVVLAVPPGMTGLWQVSGRNNRTYDERIALDVQYVQRCSLWLDFSIMFQTIPVVLRGDGAH